MKGEDEGRGRSGSDALIEWRFSGNSNEGRNRQLLGAGGRVGGWAGGREARVLFDLVGGIYFGEELLLERAEVDVPPLGRTVGAVVLAGSRRRDPHDVLLAQELMPIPHL